MLHHRLRYWLEAPRLFSSCEKPGLEPHRKIAATSIASQTINYLLLSSGLGNLLLTKQILQRQLPDMLIRYSGDQGALASHQLNPLLYHELGHTQHYI
jgi:hypothetical protein